MMILLDLSYTSYLSRSCLNVVLFVVSFLHFFHHGHPFLQELVRLFECMQQDPFFLHQIQMLVKRMVLVIYAEYAFITGLKKNQINVWVLMGFATVNLGMSVQLMKYHSRGV